MQKQLKSATGELATGKSATGGQGFDVAGLCRHFSELSPQPMVAVEGRTHIVRYLNPAFSRMVGKPRAELIDRPFDQSVPEGICNGCPSLLDRVYQSGEPEILADQEHDDGQSAPAYWSYSVWAVVGLDERPTGVMIQVTDTTEVAVFRQQVVAMNQQLLISGTRQHELTEEAEKANQLKDEFLATLSHELRTPLTVIVGWAEILCNSPLDPGIRLRGINAILRNARTQTLLIDDLLDVSLIVTGKLRLTMQPVNLGSTIVAVVEGLRPAAEAKELTLQLKIDAPLDRVSGDPERLQQVAWNLISNAIKFTPKGGHVTVQLQRLDSSIELTVSDTGKGIATEFLPHVFDRFRQADSTSTRSFGGLGLGLAIVRQLVELHGGTVRVHSDGEGHGATFTVDLPLIPARNAGSSTELLPEARQIEFQCPPELDGLHVLVVDDEVDTRELLQIILEGCGVKVKVVGSATAALEAIAEQTFDVLISDIGMPEEDGCSLLTRVRALANERGEKVPQAAALTAYVTERDRIRVLQAGFQIHVPKPISPSELVAVVANLAGRSR